jgi:aminopeptidase YwaD
MTAMCPCRDDRSMDSTWLKSRIGAHVTALAEEIGPRPPGSPANRVATDYLRMVLGATGLEVSELPFSCRWWDPGPAAVQVGGAWIDVAPAPYSGPCDVRGQVRRIGDDAALAEAPIEPGRILVIHGDLVSDPYFPKAFPFLDQPEQRSRIDRLEHLQPAAVIAVGSTTRAIPLLEDGDLDFPYAVVPRSLGDRMRDGREVGVRIGGELLDGEGVNVSARHGPPGPRLVLSAHVDSKVTGPGAFDNAGGVATLLALAEAGLPAGAAVELVFFNGEDHYQAPGEQAWLAATDLAEVGQIVNLDGAGVVGHGTAVSMLACPQDLEDRVRAAVARRPGWSIGPEWYESDHAIFAMRGIPSLAITSAGVHQLLTSVAHTERDTPRMVDPAILAGVAGFLEAWLREPSRVGV